MIVKADIKQSILTNKHEAYITIDQFIKCITNLYNNKFVFRGQENTQYKLIPNAFRKDILEKIPNGFPIKLYDNCIHSPEYSQCVLLLLHNNAVDNVYVKRITELLN